MARPKLGVGDTERLQLKISSNELEMIENWRFEKRVPSRSEAVRRLVQIGIELERWSTSIDESVSVAINEFGSALQAYENARAGGQPIDEQLRLLDKVAEEASASLMVLAIDSAFAASFVRQMHSGQSVEDAIEAAKGRQREMDEHLKQVLSKVPEK